MKPCFNIASNILSVAVFVFTLANLTDTASAKSMKCSLAHKKYINDKHLHKAFATSGGNALSVPNTACGGAGNFSTKEAAKVGALKSCDHYKKIDPKALKCRIVDVQ